MRRPQSVFSRAFRHVCLITNFLGNCLGSRFGVIVVAPRVVGWDRVRWLRFAWYWNVKWVVSTSLSIHANGRRGVYPTTLPLHQSDSCMQSCAGWKICCELNVFYGNTRYCGGRGVSFSSILQLESGLEHASMGVLVPFFFIVMRRK